MLRETLDKEAYMSIYNGDVRFTAGRSAW